MILRTCLLLCTLVCIHAPIANAEIIESGLLRNNYFQVSYITDFDAEGPGLYDATGISGKFHVRPKFDSPTIITGSASLVDFGRSDLNIISFDAGWLLPLSKSLVATPLLGYRAFQTSRSNSSKDELDHGPHISAEMRWQPFDWYLGHANVGFGTYGDSDGYDAEVGGKIRLATNFAVHASFQVHDIDASPTNVRFESIKLGLAWFVP